MRRWTAAEAVAHEEWPEERRAERILGEGGEREWRVVARRRARVRGWERKSALPWEAMSLIMAIRFRSLSFVMSHIMSVCVCG